jgi:hypothetical protein
MKVGVFGCESRLKSHLFYEITLLMNYSVDLYYVGPLCGTPYGADVYRVDDCVETASSDNYQTCGLNPDFQQYYISDCFLVESAEAAFRQVVPGVDVTSCITLVFWCSLLRFRDLSRLKLW